MKMVGEIQAVRLKCEYRENPLGIDSEFPRLSWIVQSSQRRQKQTAYRVLVASSPEILACDEGDLWDSGKVESDQSIQVEYAGTKLTSFMQCFWKVCVWDADGVISPWSEIACWTMGLLSESDWDAKWIGPVRNLSALEDNPSRGEMSPAMWQERKASRPDVDFTPERLPLLRREFEADKTICRAVVSVCGLGHYELQLNGRRVGDSVIDPGWTDYAKRCLYSTYDVTGLMNHGRNCLAAMLGNGMFHERGQRFWKFVGSYGSPQMILHLRIEYADGTVSTITTDESWRISPGPITYSSIFGGEDYDARLEQPGWENVGFDDSDWQAATVVDSPGGVLVAQSAPPVKVMETFKPISVTEPAPGVYLYDLGQNFSGWPVLSFRGPAGAVVRITPAETLNQQGMAWQSWEWDGGGVTTFSYTLKGKGVETWQPKFTYYGFRYIQVEGAIPEAVAHTADCLIVHIEGQFIRNSAGRVGGFSCSNDLLNKIHRLVDWGIGSNLQSSLTDCPHREKLGWLEICHLMAPSIMYNYDVPGFYAKVARDTIDSQCADGMIPTIAPEYVVFGGPFRDSPAWGSGAVVIPWLLYRWYGDRRALAECYETMKRYVDYLTSRAQNYIVALGLGDWGDIPDIETHQGWAQLTPISLTDTAMYYLDADILAKTAKLLGKQEDARAYASLVDEIKSAFNKAYFNPQTNRYADGTPIVPNEIRSEWNREILDEKSDTYASPSQTSQALPLALGLVDPERVEAVFAYLIEDVQKREYVTAGDVGHRFLLRALAEHSRSDLVNRLHNRTTNPGYGWQIEQGCTALAEAWDGRNVASLNHCQMGHIQEWFHAYLLGIQCDPEAVAFKRIVIQPNVVGDVTWAKGHYESMYGLIEVSWRIENDKFTLAVTIPANTSATVHVPTTQLQSVREGDKPADQVKEITFLGTGSDTAIYQVESGCYRFSALWNRGI